MTAPGLRATQVAALAPLREALLAQARAEADRLTAEAVAQAEEDLARADAQASAVIAGARAEGAADAAALVQAARASARRRARRTRLAAQTRAYAELRRRSIAALGALRDSPAYPAWLAALTEQARTALGPSAAVTEHPAGGIVATVPGRRLDLSLPALADRAMADLGEEVVTLWAP